VLDLIIKLNPQPDERRAQQFWQAELLVSDRQLAEIHQVEGVRLSSWLLAVALVRLLARDAPISLVHAISR